MRMLEINHSDFVRLITFIQKNYGIDLSKKKQLIQSRLQTTLLNEGFTDFTQYVDHIVATTNYNDIETMINKLTTNYTYFLREKEHFDFLKNTALPYLVSTKKTKSLNHVASEIGFIAVDIVPIPKNNIPNPKAILAISLTFFFLATIFL